MADALATGRRTPLMNGRRELRAQIFPDRLAAWFNVATSPGGRATTVLFPRIDPDATPALGSEEHALSDRDFMTTQTFTRYPDVFDLAHADPNAAHAARRDITALLTELPHHTVTLGHDIAANADFLKKLVDGD